jgi:flagellin
MVINTNVSAQRSSQLLADSSTRLAKSLARLSSGSRIVSPEDDAAGLAVSLKFDAQINRIAAASTNVTSAISYSQTQDGFLQKVGKALDRMSELSVLAQDITKTDPDRGLYDLEFQQLGAYITDIATKKFNGVTLFEATAKGVTVDSEATASLWNMAGIDLADAAYSTATGGNVSTAGAAVTSATSVSAAIVKLAEHRATVGASMARLNYTNEQLSVQKSNLSAANSRIKDVDVAEESTQFARYNILVQSGTAMLAQANATPQSALRLLG